MPSLDATIARERELLDCLGEACDRLVEEGRSAWLCREIDRLDAELDALRAEREKRR